MDYANLRLTKLYPYLIAIDLEAAAWAAFFDITDEVAIEQRRQMMRANIIASDFDEPLRPFMRSHRNEFAHQMLTDEGACSHEHFRESWEDDGDAENGPSLSGGPAFDVYTTESHSIVITGDGLIADSQVIDWDEYRFFAQLEAESRRTGDQIAPEDWRRC